MTKQNGVNDVGHHSYKNEQTYMLEVIGGSLLAGSSSRTRSVGLCIVIYEQSYKRGLSVMEYGGLFCLYRRFVKRFFSS
ncbi:hypothetical protein [Paenibacillus alvei]|uniref:Uncharacterized protein n=1 Tax=Paenibacillus alvei TaxID=44250 RepID=A0AAP6ZXQ4_PAEAL|nr:hypothetical protein [Paenibacillus alvei]MCY9581810.1 hypothetical protein [Paenibacillus alvei]NEZ40201.1 hypothetical protein [Paenibacillus alvei]NOJ71606.1 hypothetical protein [Paenibacillus alvei]